MFSHIEETSPVFKNDSGLKSCNRIDEFRNHQQREVAHALHPYTIRVGKQKTSLEVLHRETYAVKLAQIYGIHGHAAFSFSDSRKMRDADIQNPEDVFYHCMPEVPACLIPMQINFHESNLVVIETVSSCIERLVGGESIIDILESISLDVSEHDMVRLTKLESLLRGLQSIYALDLPNAFGEEHPFIKHPGISILTPDAISHDALVKFRAEYAILARLFEECLELHHKMGRLVFDRGGRPNKGFAYIGSAFVDTGYKSFCETNWSIDSAGLIDLKSLGNTSPILEYDILSKLLRLSIKNRAFLQQNVLHTPEAHSEAIPILKRAKAESLIGDEKSWLYTAGQISIEDLLNVGEVVSTYLSTYFLGYIYNMVGFANKSGLTGESDLFLTTIYNNFINADPDIFLPDSSEFFNLRLWNEYEITFHRSMFSS